MKSSPASRSDADQGKSGLERYLIRRRWWLAFLCFLGAFVLGIALSPPTGGIRRARQNAMMQQGRQIGQALFSYRQDHHGQSPHGNSSTEIFNELLKENYVTPWIFHSPMPGKVEATSTVLKPENVCFDVVDPVVDGDPDLLPVVVSTGYKLDLKPGGKATLLPSGYAEGIAVFYMGNNAVFIKSTGQDLPVIGATFDAHGKKYRQLTPTGPLP